MDDGSSGQEREMSSLFVFIDPDLENLEHSGRGSIRGQGRNSFCQTHLITPSWQDRKSERLLRMEHFPDLGIVHSFIHFFHLEFRLMIAVNRSPTSNICSILRLRSENSCQGLGGQKKLWGFWPEIFSLWKIRLPCTLTKRLPHHLKEIDIFKRPPRPSESWKALAMPLVLSSPELVKVSKRASSKNLGRFFWPALSYHYYHHHLCYYRQSFCCHTTTPITATTITTTTTTSTSHCHYDQH